MKLETTLFISRIFIQMEGREGSTESSDRKESTMNVESWQGSTAKANRENTQNWRAPTLLKIGSGNCCVFDKFFKEEDDGVKN